MVFALGLDTCHLKSCFHVFLQEKSLKTYAPNDTCLGHLLVLSQYNWPRYESILAEVVDKIKRQGSFTYNLFFNYVVSILWKFMYYLHPIYYQINTLLFFPIIVYFLSMTITFI